jgi:phage/plasmid-like protein (TIGR03299 family)
MAAAVEEMFSANNITPWHGLGRIIDEAPTSHDALVAAGLDWKVTKTPMMADVGGTAIAVPDYFANVRSSDNAVLGVVGSKYKIVQNEDAFAFTDALLHNEFGTEVHYETAGSLQGGKRVWMLAKLPAQQVLGDAVVPYLVLVNNHDGKGAVRVSMVPTRVVCQNTLTLALSQAMRSWSTTHAGNLSNKMAVAQDTLLLAQTYMASFEEKAELLQQQKLSSDQVTEILDELFPYNAFARGDKTNNRNEVYRDTIRDILANKGDLHFFRDTAWGLYNAIADFESHIQPAKRVASPTRFQERKFAGFIDASNMLSSSQQLLAKFA